MRSKRDEYVSKLKAKLDQWNSDIDQIVARVEAAAESTRKEYQEQITNMQSRRKDCEKKLHELSEAAEGAWEHLKTGVETEAAALGAAIRAAKEEYRSSVARSK